MRIHQVVLIQMKTVMIVHIQNLIEIVELQVWIKEHMLFDGYKPYYVKGEKYENIYYASKISCAVTLISINIFLIRNHA